MLSWSPEYKIGVKKIDKQHKELFQRTGNLIMACKNKEADKKIEELIEFLEEYVEKHFKDEEKIQKKSDYPNLKEHQKKHEEFVNTIKEFKKEFKAGNTGTAFLMRMNRLITNWLINHIKKTDQEIAEYI